MQNADPFMLAAYDSMMVVAEQHLLFSDQTMSHGDLDRLTRQMRPCVRFFVGELLTHMKSSFRPLTLESVLSSRDKLLAKNDSLCEILREHGQEQQAEEMERQAEMIRTLPRQVTEFDRISYIDELVARMYKIGCEPAQRTATYQTTAAAIRAMGNEFSRRLPEMTLEQLEALPDMREHLDDSCRTAVRHMRKCCQTLLRRARAKEALDQKTLDFYQKEFLLPAEHLTHLYTFALQSSVDGRA